MSEQLPARSFRPMVRSGKLPTTVIVVAALALAASPAAADEMGMGLLMGLFAVVAVAVLLPLYVIAVTLVEAWVLVGMLELRFRWAAWFALLANVASLVAGWIWMAAGGPMGWKTAMASNNWGAVGVAFLRSFVVTFLVEGLVLWLLLRRSHETREIAKATLVMNALSYVLSALLMAFW